MKIILAMLIAFLPILISVDKAGATNKQDPFFIAKRDILAAFIIKRQPMAAKYAELLAERTLIEAKRHGLKVHHFAAVGWIESDYRKGLRGRSHEIGVWQLRPVDHGMNDGLNLLRANASEFPVLKSVANRSWKRLRWKVRLRILDDIKAGTYLAAYSIMRHIKLCRRLGHRVGRHRCNKPFLNQCPRYHSHEIDRICHYNSGISWCKRAYVSKLRRRSKIIGRLLSARNIRKSMAMRKRHGQEQNEEARRQRSNQEKAARRKAPGSKRTLGFQAKPPKIGGPVKGGVDRPTIR